MPAIIEFEIIDTSWNWEDLRPEIGPGIFETYITGEGACQKEAMNDAIAQILELHQDDESCIAEILPASEDFNDESERGEMLVEKGEEVPFYLITIRWNPSDLESAQTIKEEPMTINIEPAPAQASGRR